MNDSVPRRRSYLDILKLGSKKPDRALLQDSIWFFIARVIGALAAFLTHWVLARWLGASQQGAYTDVFSWALLLSSIALLGFPRAALRYLPAYRGRNEWGATRGFVHAGLWLAIGAGAFIFACGLVWLVVIDSSAIFAVGMLSVLPLLVMNHFTGVAQGVYWRVLAALPKDTLRPVLMLLALLVMWYVMPGADVYAVMWLQLAVATVVCLGMAVIILRRLSTMYDNADPTYATREWVTTGVPMMATNLAFNLYPELNVVIVGMFLVDAEVGIFFVAFRIAFLIGFGLVAIDQATMADASRRHSLGDLAGMEHRLRHAGMIKIFGALLAFCCLVFFGAEILGLFGDGHEYQTGYIPMLWLAGIMLVRALLGPVAELLSITGHHNETAAIASVSIVLTLLLDFVLIPLYGITGAAIAAFIASSASIVLMAWRLSHAIGIAPCPIMPARVQG